MTKLQTKKIQKFQNGKLIPEIADDELPIEEWMSDTNFWNNQYEEPEAEIEPWMSKTTYWDDIYSKTPEVDSTQKSLVPDTFKAKFKENINPASLIKPIVNLASLSMNLKSLKMTRDAAKNIKAPRVDAATIANRPIKGLSPEIISLYLKNVGNLNTRKTSDATSNKIAEQMLAINKMKALEGLTTKQIEHLFKETQRHDKVQAANQIAAIKASNENTKNAVAIANQKAGIDAKYAGERQNFINKWIDEAIVQPMGKRISYNMGKRAIEDSNARNQLQNQIVNAQNRLLMEPTNRTYKTQLDELLDQQKKLGTTKLPSYGGTMNYLFS